MKILGYEFGFKKAEAENPTGTENEKQPYDVRSDSIDGFGFGGVGAGGYGGMSWPVVTKSFDGEKTPGELGLVVRDIPNYLSLRLRGYHAYATTDVIKTLVSRRMQWVIGSGLKLEFEPNKSVLQMEGVALPDGIHRIVEERWKVFSNSIYCDYEKRRNLHDLSKESYEDVFKGGDSLIVCRFDEKGLNVQVISGEHVKTPFDYDILNEKTDGNYVEHGIEFNQRGEHIAYYVCKKGGLNSVLDYERIPAYGEKSKRRMAWMVYGQKLSSDHKRGVPEFAQVLEKVAKLDRYTEASVSKAEQAAKILFSIEHDEFSTGENILTDIAKRKLRVNSDVALPNNHALADGLANKITQTTNNQTFNMPQGAKLKDFGTNIENTYQGFYDPNFDAISASVDTPPEVARQKYDSNYSASRAAINTWGYIVDIDRKKFSNQFNLPVFRLWFEWEILNNKIDAPGFVGGILNDNYMIVEAYTQCRFTGRNMPHIDPLKEIKAIREMLGNPREGITPLISHEQAVDLLDGGDFEENYQEYRDEVDGIIVNEFVEPIKTNSNGSNEEQGN